MEMNELEWLIAHKDMLTKKEKQQLKDLERLKQHRNKEIHLGIVEFLWLVEDLKELYEKHSGKTFGAVG